MLDQWQALWPPHAPPSPVRRVCIYAHFSPQHRLRASDLHQLRYLGAQARVIFVTQSHLPPHELRVIARYCMEGGVLTLPPCRGLDHSSYLRGYRHLLTQHVPHAQWLWLVNDSFYGPLCALPHWIQHVQHMEQTSAVAWGMTNSFQIEYHLQSYFRALRSSVFRAAAFHRFMQKPWHTMDYSGVVHHGELALFREVIHPRPTVALRSALAHDRSNPTFQDWRGTLLRACVLKKKKLASMSAREREQLRNLLVQRSGIPEKQLKPLLHEMQL